MTAPLSEISAQNGHTPGPWAFSPWHVEEGAPAVRHGTIHGYIIATVDTDDNAKLIAAAPDMYEALKNIKEWLMDPWTEAEAVGEAVHPDFRKALMTTFAALKKAEGRP